MAAAVLRFTEVVLHPLAQAVKQLTIETEREVDGRWIAEVPELPGTMVYGSTRDEAIAHVEVLALRVLAERIEAGGRPATEGN